MKMFKGKSDRWGFGVFYCKFDQSISFDFLHWYIAFTFYKYWKD